MTAVTDRRYSAAASPENTGILPARRINRLPCFKIRGWPNFARGGVMPDA